MVQTKAGAKRSEWIQFIAEMSVLYRQRQLCTKVSTVTTRRRRRPPPESLERPSDSSNDPTVAIPSDSPDTSSPA